ncbi:hypothetical protein HGRIS_012726 [Hohenbuehelia grisea]|uniref:MTHFR SAM-binding regulatory domain-containing protein n=1 Tax=Hohenbuehelia grisea TaxID=104357 RepID=A0ABR3IT55_9AGAR
MKLHEKIAQHTAPRPFYTLEFFPPRTDQGFENLASRIARLAELNPLAISITWGAGGSTKDRSLELAGLTQMEYGVDTVLHLTCTNMEKGTVDHVLRAAKERGIETILALRGDPPRGEEDWTATDSRFSYAKDLVSYIRSTPEFASAFSIGVAAYPDGHTESASDVEAQIQHLKEKVDAGADFIVTQLFYDVDGFLQWIKEVRAAGITVPIIPGIMPIQTYSSFKRLIKLSGARVPQDLSAELDPISHDDQKVKDFGVNLTVEMIRRLNSEGNIQGFHICTLNLEKSVLRVLEGLQWTGAVQPPQNKLIADTPGAMVHPPTPKSEFVTTPTRATNSAKLGLVELPSIEEAGKGELNKAATWDDFPNGRFGDFKSPAYGDQGPWGGTQMTNEAFDQWGHPRSDSDLTSLFLAHLNSKVPRLPFYDGPVSAETSMILPHLERLNKRGWWTVGSQPTVDGAPSNDSVVGWGPSAGYVFQKGFVEFFCELRDVEDLERRVASQGGLVHLLAGNYQGEFKTNIPEGGRNAVTWGIFPGQEITQSTIIEPESFLNWKDDAYSIWTEWASFYRPGSEERKYLESVRDNRWLVSIVHHDYKDLEALWNFLFDEAQ